MRADEDYDLAIIGAGFAGLIAAATAAARGLRVVVLETKEKSGARVKTTGILVKEAAEELDFPTPLTRKLRTVRLYAPNLNHADLSSPGYYFLATDTGALLDWLAARAEKAGAKILTGARFRDAQIRDGRVVIDPQGVSARFIIGADGAHSRVARIFGLGVNRRFLIGLEARFTQAKRETNEIMHCFLDSKLGRLSGS